MTEAKYKSKANLLVKWKIVDADELIQIAQLISKGVITKEHLLSGNGHKIQTLPAVDQKEAIEPVIGACPECGANMVKEGGCSMCYSCGFSLCS